MSNPILYGLEQWCRQQRLEHCLSWDRLTVYKGSRGNARLELMVYGVRVRVLARDHAQSVAAELGYLELADPGLLDRLTGLLGQPHRGPLEES